LSTGKPFFADEAYGGNALIFLSIFFSSFILKVNFAVAKKDEQVFLNHKQE
jgi:hypothetical protein